MHLDELEVLTSRLNEMCSWWVAALGASVSHQGGRSARLTGLNTTIHLTYSQLALDAHPEAAGIVSVTLNATDIIDAVAALDRLRGWGARHHRATQDEQGIRLWFVDPDGNSVALRAPSRVHIDSQHNDEVDPDLAEAAIRAAASPAH